MKNLLITVSSGFLAVAVTAFAVLYHGHTYDRSWEYDETHHWKRSTCDCGEISDFAEHMAGEDGFCFVCEYPVSPTPWIEYAVSENGESAKVVQFLGGIDQNRANISSTYQDLPVTEIGEGAFEGLDALTTVVIPQTVTQIGVRAFFGCSMLSNLKMGENITAIGGNAFSGCASLEELALPQTVAEIGEFAFSNCSGLRTVNLANSVQVISRGAFVGCTKLTAVTLGGNVTEIGESAFAHCTNLASVTIQDGVQKIGYAAFNNCRMLKSVVLPESVVELKELAFDEISVFFKGGLETWQQVVKPIEAKWAVYIYSESEPALNGEGSAYDGNYWRYIDGVPTVWEYDT